MVRLNFKKFFFSCLPVSNKLNKNNLMGFKIFIKSDISLLYIGISTAERIPTIAQLK